VYTYIDLMDITVMARSNWYGSPVKIFEYGAMGKAIIAPDTVPVRDVMIDGEDGLLVEPVVSLISSALSRLISDKEERSRFGRNFQRKVLEKYTWMRNARTALEGL
jgi:glycosyltransferase involved in cell wall biosynthesis